MPYSVRHRGRMWCVIKKTTGTPIPGGCHKSKQDALKHLAAVEANTKE